MLVINDLTEGHYEALAAALPFVPVAIMKATRIERAGTREVLQTALGAEKWTRIQNLRTISNLAERVRVANQTVLNDVEMYVTMRRILTGPGGSVPTPTWRGELEYLMSKRVPRPTSGPHIAHHDLPWQFRREFARAGINVNDPAFGRWAPKANHDYWHYKASPKFNDFWAQFWAGFTGNTSPTQQMILEKLAEARSRYQ